MKQLIEDYKRRLATIEQLNFEFKSNGSEHDIRKKERFNTKASEYRTIITELERIESNHIVLTKEEIQIFGNDCAKQVGWSDSSLRIVEFMKIVEFMADNPTQKNQIKIK